MSFAEKDCFQRFIADEVGTQKKEVGILLPGNILDELTCWTPRALGRNSKTFLGLRRLNGRPLFVWIAQSFFKSSTAKIAKLYVLCPGRNQALITFIRSHYPRNLIECLYKGSLREKLLTILEMEKGKASSITFLRDNALSTEPILRTKKELVSLDGRTLYWHNKDILSLQEIVENTKEDFLLKKEILKAVGLCFHEIKGIEKKKYLMIDNDSDFGVAKSQLIESRSFNSLKIHPLFPEIVKSSTDKQKLEYEVFWYQGVPEQFRALTPRILKYDESGVRMEYYGYGTLTEKFLYDNLPLEEWEIVLRKLFRIVDLFSREKIESNQNTFRDFYLNKFSVRCERARELPELGELFDRKQIVVNGVKYRGLPKLISFIKRKLEEISETAVGSIGHGDLCFNNILYDRGSGVIKLIDPRGNIGGVPSIMCDSRYDIAKLKHSFCGNYDGVVEGEFFLDENDNGFDFYLSRSETVRDRELLFKQLCLEFGFCFETISFIEAYLFLTMIPLHKDSVRKMKAFFLISIVKFNQCLEFQDENLCRS